jgi:hypothetical protein
MPLFTFNFKNGLKKNYASFSKVGIVSLAIAISLEAGFIHTQKEIPPAFKRFDSSNSEGAFIPGKNPF